MASSKDYLEFILGQLCELEDLSYRAMMGEFILYYKGKIVGGIYDDRLLVKAVESAITYMPNAEYELPYEGAKEMLLVDDVDNREYLAGLFEAMYDELPVPKPKRLSKYSLKNDVLCTEYVLKNVDACQKLIQNNERVVKWMCRRYEK